MKLVSLVLCAFALAASHNSAAATPVALAGRDDAPAANAPAIVWPTFVGPVNFTPVKAGLTPPEAGQPITAGARDPAHHGQGHGHHHG